MVNNALYMAGTEMREIRELDEETFRTHSSKIYGFYGQTDGWVPLNHYHEMRETLPASQVHLCDEDIPHAFVLGKGEKLGKVVGSTLASYRQSTAPPSSHL